MKHFGIPKASSSASPTSYFITDDFKTSNPNHLSGDALGHRLLPRSLILEARAGRRQKALDNDIENVSFQKDPSGSWVTEDPKLTSSSTHSPSHNISLEDLKEKGTAALKHLKRNETTGQSLEVSAEEMAPE